MPSKDQTASQFNSLVNDQGQSEADRQKLMNKPDATVMTSPQTGQLVDNAATATAPVQSAAVPNGNSVPVAPNRQRACVREHRDCGAAA